METLQAINIRRSVRSYQDRPVGRDILAQLVEAGTKAPGAGPMKTIVITNRDYLNRIDGETLNFMLNSGDDFMVGRASQDGYHPLYGAPALIVLAADPGRGTANVAAAATTVILAATALGLGSCYLASITRVLDGKNELSQSLELPDGLVPLAGVIVGYTDDPKKFSRDRAPAAPATYIE